MSLDDSRRAPDYLLGRLAWPASASARVNWVCDVPGEGRVVFVSASDAARHGIETANAHAGQTFLRNFGEVCTVENA